MVHRQLTVVERCLQHACCDAEADGVANNPVQHADHSLRSLWGGHGLYWALVFLQRGAIEQLGSHTRHTKTDVL